MKYTLKNWSCGGWVYMNSFELYSDAVDERERLSRLHPMWKLEVFAN